MHAGVMSNSVQYISHADGLDLDEVMLKEMTMETRF